MPHTIRKEDEAESARCPKCGARMAHRSTAGDLRESSKGTYALICTACGYRES